VDLIRLCNYKGGVAVLDGQNRLKAVVKAGVNMDFWFAFNVPESAFKHIDQGVPRSLNHVMQSAGWPSATILSATGRFLYSHTSGNVTAGLLNKGVNVSPGTLFDSLADKYPDLRSLWITYGKVISRAAKRCHITPAALYYFFYMAEKIDHDQAVSLIAYLADSYDTKAPDRVYRLMVGRLDQNNADFQKAKDLGREIRAELKTADQYQVIRFAWLCKTTGIATPTTLAGFNKTHNKWVSNGGDVVPWNLY
jgi:hypothetical protein